MSVSRFLLVLIRLIKLLIPGIRPFKTNIRKVINSITAVSFNNVTIVTRIRHYSYCHGNPTHKKNLPITPVTRLFTFCNIRPCREISCRVAYA